MQSTLRSTSRPAARGSIIGYLWTLVLLVCAIGLLALGTPSSSSTPTSVYLGAPAAVSMTAPHALLYQIDR